MKLKKLVNNIIIRTYENGSVVLTQSGDNFTHKTTHQHTKKLPEIYTCVDTEKFIAVYNQEAQVSLTDLGLEIGTGRVKATLPLMKEYGLFSVNPEISPEGEVLTTFDLDLSKVDLDLTEAQGQFSYIMLNSNFVCRYLYNTLSFYGELTDEDYYCVTPKQFRLMKTLGKMEVSVYQAHLKIISEEEELVLKLHNPVVNLRLIERFFKAKPQCTFEAPKLDIKKIKLFAEEMLDFDSIEGKQLKVSSLGYEEIFDISEEVELHGQFYLKDLEFIKGEMSIYREKPFFYSICKYENRTVLFLGKEKPMVVKPTPNGNLENETPF